MRISDCSSDVCASEDLLRDLDILLLTKAVEEIFQRPPGKNGVFVVNIHFSTLDGKKRLEHLKKLCSTLTDPARAALIFNIVEIPADLLPAKRSEEHTSEIQSLISISYAV